MLVLLVKIIPLNRAMASTINLSNPRIEKDDTMQSGQNVTWDCIYFGSYPQSEVQVSESVHNTLASASGWDSQGNITISGTKYRRYKDFAGYHYFKYEPIKWRVLQIDGNEVFLLSDLVIDSEAYDYSYVDGSHRWLYVLKWKDATSRSWLNGYGSSSNHMSIDYSNNNFIDTAFTETQQNAILNTTLKNPEGIYSENRTEGTDTVDKIFYLSEPEICGFEAVKYGFLCDYVGDSYDEYITTYDEARRGVGSEYANVKGLKYIGPYGNDKYYYYNDYCFWLSRSMTHLKWLPYLVYPAGNLANNLGIVDEWTLPYNTGVRPAMKIDLATIKDYSYAGTVCSSDYKARLRVDSLTITLSNAQYVYDGKSKTPAVTVKNGSTILKNTTDYTLSYVNNINTGIATVTITGKGRYVGSKSVTFNILPNNVTSLKQSSPYSTTSITLSWKNVAGATGYEVYRATNKNGKYIKVKTTTSSRVKNGKLSRGKTYYYKVRAYKTVNGTKIYGRFYSVVAMGTKPKTPSIELRSGNKKAKVIWKKISGISGYEVYMSKKSSGCFSKVKTSGSKNTAYLKKGLISGKKYYFKVRSYRTVGGKKIYSSWSKVKTVKIK